MKRLATSLFLAGTFASFSALSPSLAWAADEPNAPQPPPPSSSSSPSPAPAAVAPPTIGTAKTGTPPPAPAASTADGPVVELSADEPHATIERRASTTSPTVPLFETGVLSVGHWEHACIAPCQLRLDSRYAYRVAGDGLVPTDSFAIPRGQDRVRVEAKMGSSVGRTAGVLATIGGVMAIAGGGLALAATPILESEEVGSKGFRSAVLVGGVTVASVGVITTAIGLYLWLSNGSTARTETPFASPQARR